MEKKFEYCLNCEYDSAKSFHNKAKVRVYETDDIEHLELVSYDTLVANYVYYKNEHKRVFEYFGKYTDTTTRHQKEFFRQLGITDKGLKELWLNGRLEISDFDE